MVVEIVSWVLALVISFSAGYLHGLNSEIRRQRETLGY